MHAQALPNGEGAAVLRALSAELVEVDTLITTLTKPANAPYWSAGPRVSERIGALLRNVDAGNFPPTGPQQALSKELAAELKAVREIENIFFAVGRSQMKAAGLDSGLILNFGSMPLGIKRIGRERSES